MAVGLLGGGGSAVAQYEIALVPHDFATIQDAINDVNDGTLIRVAQGTYYEHIDFLGKTIYVESTDPDNPEVVANTIIDGQVGGQKYGDVVVFQNGETNATRLSGFTIRNGWHGVRILNASPKIINCVITDNDATLDPRAPDAGGSCGLGTGWGAGIAVGHDRLCTGTSYTYDVLIGNCTIEDNVAIGGAGVYYRGFSDTSLFDSNTIRNNALVLVPPRGGFTAGAWLENRTGNYAGVVFEDNILDNNSGETCVDVTPALFARNVTITGNVIKNHRLWCALHPVRVAGVLADANTVYNNFALGPELENIPLAIQVGSGTSTLTNNVFHGEVVLDSSGAITMEVCTVVGEVVVGGQATVSMTNSIAWPLDSGPGITVESGGTATATYCDVRGGFTGTGNFDANPLFAVPAGDKVFRITCNSPCRERGELTAVYDGPTHDIDGQSRPLGDRVDVGADEKHFCFEG